MGNQRSRCQKDEKGLSQYNFIFGRGVLEVLGFIFRVEGIWILVLCFVLWMVVVFASIFFAEITNFICTNFS